MIEQIVRFSVKNKLIVGLLVLALIAAGVYSMQKLPVDAVPDITNNQVQIVTTSPSLAPQEVEQSITFPVEMAMANLPGVEEIRSVSRFGLSLVTVVFEEDVPVLEARQLVKEQIDVAKAEIPASLGNPELMPITTGLGEIYQYVLEVDSAYRNQYDSIELRTIQDWIVKRQLMGMKGIIEVSSFGGYLKQYEVSVDPLLLQSHDVTISEVMSALERNNQNSGGSYIEKGKNAYYIRTEGLVKTTEEIGSILVKTNGEAPVFVRDVAKVQFGSPPRFGALTMDGEGEVVGGITLMLKGANSSEAIDNVHKRVAEVQRSLPPGIHIYPYLDRSVLVGKAIHTVSKNLIEGGLVVIFVLILLLGNIRAGLIVASVIPLSLLFAFILMYAFGVSANLMSLGAIDFGIVIDGAVIVVEGVLHLLHSKYLGKKLDQNQMNNAIIQTASGIIGSAAFGVLIIIVVFVPVITLTGIEGKMFTPMAKTVSFAIIGALLLSVTYVPMMSSLFLKKNIRDHVSFADRIVGWIQKIYRPTLERVMRIPGLLISGAIALLVGTFLVFGSMGGEFIPTLDEGDLAMQVTIPPGSSLTEMMRVTSRAERILKENFPEVKHVVSKIGTAEVPTDPMAVEDADVMILLKEHSEWVSASNREELVEKMKEKLKVVNEASFEFTQPIQLRFNELISGAKTDVVIKLFGDDLEELAHRGKDIAKIVKTIQGAGDVKIEQTEGLPQLMIRFNREKIAWHHLDIDELNRIVRAAYAGENTGIVYEGERRFDLTVRLNKSFRNTVDLSQLFVSNSFGESVPLSEVATLEVQDGPMLVSRENARRRIAVGVNVRNRDIESFINEVRQKLEGKIPLKPGYFLEYGGQFENLVAARARLAVAVPVALALIFVLLFFAFRSVKYALLIYSTVPLAAVGGVVALLLRGMPFSISAGIGFIALFGVAVLNGIVLISYFNRLKEEGETDIRKLVVKGSLIRLRPVLMTAAVASLGFLPMALSTSSGAEVQKPLATVVIGGLITATLLTLLVLPVIYYLAERKQFRMKKKGAAAIGLLFLLAQPLQAQELTESMAIDSMKHYLPELRNGELYREKSEYDRKAALSLPNTEFGYQYGQMNTALMDQYLSVNQPLGNPLMQVRSGQQAGAQTQLLGLEQQQREEYWRWQVRRTWQEWVLSAYRMQLLQEQVTVMDEHLRREEARQQSGEISRVDYNMALLYKGDLDKQLETVRLRVGVLQQQLRGLTGIQGEIQAPQWTPERLSMPGFRDSSGVLLQIADARRDVAAKDLQLAKAGWFPDLNVGYFNQTLDHARGFQGWTFGVQVPLFNRSTAMQVKKARLDVEIQENSFEQIRMDLETIRENLAREAEMYASLLNTYESNWLPQSALLRESAQYELDAGAIDYFKYVQARARALDMEMNWLDTLLGYNEAVLALGYYVSSQDN